LLLNQHNGDDAPKKKPMYIFYHISLSPSCNEKIFQTEIVDKIKHTFCVQ
jgi:hypothetical protein